MDFQKIVGRVIAGGFDYLFIGPSGGGTVIVMDKRLRSGYRSEEKSDEPFPVDGEKAVSDELDRLLNSGCVSGSRRWDVRFAWSGGKFIGIRCFGPQADFFDRAGRPRVGFGGVSSGAGCSSSSGGGECKPSDCKSCKSGKKKKP